MEERDEFEKTEKEIDLDALKVGSAGIEDLLMVIKKATSQMHCHVYPFAKACSCASTHKCAL